MAVYTKQIETAQRLILKKGMSVTHRQIIEGALVDSSEPWKKTNGTPTDQSIVMAFFNETRKDQEPSIREYESLVGTGLIYGLTAHITGLNITLKNLIIRNSIVYKIRYVRCLQVNDEPILWKVGLRA